MSFGKLSTFIELITLEKVKDKQGFVTTKDNIIANTRAYYEPRHGSEKWANRAVFTTATALFRFRAMPGLTIKTDIVIVCEHGRFNIVSVDDVRQRNMYIEVLAEKVIASG